MHPRTEAALRQYLAANERASEVLDLLKTVGLVWPGKTDALRRARERVQKTLSSASSAQLEELASDIVDHEIEWFDADELLESLQTRAPLSGALSSAKKQFEAAENYFLKAVEL